MRDMSSDRPTGVALLEALEAGVVRAAEPDPEGGWLVHAWVKEEILALFRASEIVPQGLEGTSPPFAFRDKEPLTVRRFEGEDGVRIVPGGSAVRRGAHLAPGVVCMPPMYVNIGAWVGEGSMIDSHALVGSCAQVGAGVHVSAGAQIGGVLEPAGARPVIVEDGAFLGANTGVFDGVLIGRGAVLAAGLVLTRGTVVHDLVNESLLRGDPDRPLEIPPGAVVVPGSRPVSGDYGRKHGLTAACGLIVKYRDERTDAATALEEALR